MFCAVRLALACRATHYWSGHGEGEKVGDERVYLSRGWVMTEDG